MATMTQLFGHEKLKVYQKGMGFQRSAARCWMACSAELQRATTLIVPQKVFW